METQDSSPMTTQEDHLSNMFWWNLIALGVGVLINFAIWTEWDANLMVPWDAVFFLLSAPLALAWFAFIIFATGYGIANRFKQGSWFLILCPLLILVATIWNGWAHFSLF